MNSFIYDIPTKVYFGEHQLSHLGEELAKYGKRVLLTYGGGSIKKSGLYDAVAAEVKAAGLTSSSFPASSRIPVSIPCGPARRSAKRNASTCCWR